MKITILGAGYVGLVSGTCYATTGNHVTIVDVDPDRIAALRRGEVPIYEVGLDVLIHENLESERLNFTTDLAEACRDAEVIGLAVGTPQDEQGKCNLQYVFQAAEEIASHIAPETTVVTKSTVPVGTGRKVQEIIASRTNVPFDYVSNPEFLKEGSAVDDFMYPERVILGTESERARRKMRHLYTPFMRRSDRILFMDVESAELAKYACNSMLALRISFMNELSRFAETIGADIQDVRLAMGTDRRIGNAFLFPGLGYGGSCFPKDVQALAHTAGEHGHDLQLVIKTHEVNQQQVDYFFEKIDSYFDSHLQGRHFALWGLAFKPRTDDVREAPAIKIAERLLERGATVCGYDPEARATTEAVLGDRIQYANKSYEALHGADGLVICTEWLEFRTPDFREIRNQLKRPVIFDGRNLYDPEMVRKEGIDYHCLGRSRKRSLAHADS
jgi:UDPglucose 6-dehydrogenase